MVRALRLGACLGKLEIPSLILIRLLVAAVTQMPNSRPGPQMPKRVRNNRIIWQKVEGGRRRRCRRCILTPRSQLQSATAARGMPHDALSWAFVVAARVKFK